VQYFPSVPEKSRIQAVKWLNGCNVVVNKSVEGHIGSCFAAVMAVAFFLPFTRMHHAVTVMMMAVWTKLVHLM